MTTIHCPRCHAGFDLIVEPVDIYDSHKPQPGEEAVAAINRRKHPPAAPPLPSAQQMDERRQEQRYDAKLEQCPDHGLARRSKKSGGLFCPTSTDGGYCQWTNTQAA